MSEAEIQSEILEWLKLHKFFYRRVPLGPVKHGGILKKNPLKGFPDILVVLPGGRLCMIEVKHKKKLSDSQQIVICELEKAGALVLVAHSLQDVEQVLIKFLVAS